MRRDVYVQTQMLRELVSTERRTLDGAPPGAATVVPRDRPRLLVMHQGDYRLRGPAHVPGGLGYRGSVLGTPEEVVAALARGPQPDVLLTACSPQGACGDLAFPRECLARWPSLRALYVCFIPQQLPNLLVGRELVLAAPFNAQELAAAVNALWP